MATDDQPDIEDAAILVMSLGEENAAEVFKHLEPKEVQRLGETIARLKTVPRERIDGVIRKFSALVRGQEVLVDDPDAYVKSILKKALGDEKAGLLIDRISQGEDVSGIESLKWMDAPAVAELLRNEHPQIVATILVHLDHEHSANILRLCTERQRNEVLVRIATLEGVQPIALKDLNDVLSQLLAGGERTRRTSMGGVKPAAEILNILGSAIETATLNYITETDAEIAQKIIDNMLVFDDLESLDDRGMQILLREVQGEQLVISLKGASQALRDKVLKNMSTRAADSLREDLETRGPVRLSEVENEQKEILKIVRRLSDEGQISLGGNGEDAYV